MKKISIITLSILIFFLIILEIIVFTNNSTYIFPISNIEGDYYYSDAFTIKSPNIKVSSTMDTSIDIINIDDESDLISIGYLTPGLSKKIKIDVSKRYRIRTSSANDNLLITVSNIKDTWPICYNNEDIRTIK